MTIEEVILEAKVTERILEETVNSIAELERIIRKPLPPAQLSQILSLYSELAQARDALLFPC
jgi:hypothetical protein